MVENLAIHAFTHSPLPGSSHKRTSFSKRVSIGLGDSCHIRPSLFDEKLRSEHGKYVPNDVFMRSPTRAGKNVPNDLFVKSPTRAVGSRSLDAMWGNEKQPQFEYEKRVPNAVTEDGGEPATLMKEVFLRSPKKVDAFGSSSHHFRSGFFDRSPKKVDLFGSSHHHSNAFLDQKRRHSAMMISPNFFDDQERRFERRDSIGSVESFASETHEETEGKNFSLTECHPPLKQPSEPPSLFSQRNPLFVPQVSAVDLVEAKAIMENFTDAMMKSMQTQQAIHDWDKKMGLKRSHSKTMRLSMRSRKKLKTLIKKDIIAITSGS